MKSHQGTDVNEVADVLANSGMELQLSQDESGKSDIYHDEVKSFTKKAIAQRREDVLLDSVSTV